MTSTSSDSDSKPALEPGFELGPYTIQRLIGRGGMGEVYHAVDTGTKRNVAIKVISSARTSDETVVQRFKQEGKTLSLINNPNVVTVYTVGEEKGFHYIAMEYIEGKSLAEIGANFALPGNEAAPLFIQMLSGLEALSSKGVVHRDLKPQNIIYQKDNVIKILDLGISKVYGGTQTMLATSTGMIMGTVQYLAPEIAAGQPATVASDLWSLGAIFYEMLTGFPLINASNQLHALSRLVTFKFTVSPELQTMIDPDMQVILQKMCDRDLARRYRSPKDALADLQVYSQKHPSKGLWLYRCIGCEINNLDKIKQSLAQKGLRPVAVKRVLAEAISESQKIPIQTHGDKTVALDAVESIHISEDSLKTAIAKMRSIPIKFEPPRGTKRSLAPYVMTLAVALAAGLWAVKKSGFMNQPPITANLPVATPVTAPVATAPAVNPPPEVKPPEPPPPPELPVAQTQAEAEANAPGEPPSSELPKTETAAAKSEPNKVLPSSAAKSPAPKKDNFVFSSPENLTPKTISTLKFAGSAGRAPSSSDATLTNPPQLKWTPLQGASGYQLEIADDDSFSRPLLSFRTAGSVYTWKSAKPGDFYWRVKALSGDGRQSNHSEVGRLTLKVIPPTLAPSFNFEISQADGANRKVNIAWNEMPFVAKYSVTLTDAKNRSKVIQDEVITDHQLKTELPAGEYQLSVAALDNKGATISDRSPASRVTVKYLASISAPELLSPPDASTIVMSDSLSAPTVFYWKPVDKAQSYQLEIGGDATFKKIIVSEKNEGNRLILRQKLPAGKLFWRVRSQSPTGSSTWSQARTLKIETTAR